MGLGGASQLLKLLHPKFVSSLSWLVCKMCTCSRCFFVDLKLTHRGKGKRSWQSEGKDIGQPIAIIDGYGCINGNEWEFIQNQKFPKLAMNPHNKAVGNIAKGREMDPSAG